MATIRKIEQKRGTVFRAVIRTKGQNLSRTFRRKSDATKWASKTEADVAATNAGLILTGQRHSLNDTIERYSKEILPTKSEGTQNAYKGQLEYWSAALGAMKLADISSEHIARCRDFLSDENIAATNKPARKRSPATVNRYLAALGAVFSAAVHDWHWLNNSPVRATRKKSEPRGRTRFLSQGEVTALLSACKESESPELYPAVLLSLTTGARRGEIMNLRWECIDWGKGTAYIPQTKNGDPRLLALMPEALDLLRDRRELDGTVKLQGLVFPSTVSETQPILLEKAWRNAKARAGLTDFRWHDLRHTAASFMAANGATLLAIGATLGHRSTQTTARYSHLVQDATHDLVRDTMSKMLGNKNDV